MIRTLMHLLWHLTHPRTGCAPEEAVDISDIQLQRKMIYDAFADATLVAEVAGLPGISSEVDEMEQAAHEQRMVNVLPVLPLLIGQSDFMGHAAALMQCWGAGVDPAEDGEQLLAVQLVLTNVIKASVIASVSTALDMGAIQILKEVFVEHD